MKLLMLVLIVVSLYFGVIRISEADTPALTIQKEKPLSRSDLIADAARVYGHKPIEIEAIIKVESGGNPEAINVNDNKTLDVGLMQLNSAYLKDVKLQIKDALDEKTNIEYGSIKWKDCKRREAAFSKVKSELYVNAGACYNGGAGWRRNAENKKIKAIEHGRKILAEIEKNLLEKNL